MIESQEATLGIGAVARRTGLTPDVLRVWERRYHAVTPYRTEGGTRLYTDAQVRRLEMLAGLVARGHRIGRIARLDDDALATLFFDDAGPGAIAVDAASGPAGAQAGGDGLIPRVLEALAHVDSAAVERLLKQAFLTLGPRTFTFEVALPLLREVGERWASGQLSIAAEHAVVAVLRTLLGGAIQRRDDGTQRDRVLFVTPSGQRHEFGVLAAALLASGLGVDAVYLGPDLPVAEVALARERTGAGLVVVGLAPHPQAAGGWSAYLETLRAVLPADVELWIGGEGSLEVAQRVGGEGFESLEDFERRLAISHPSELRRSAG